MASVNKTTDYSKRVVRAGSASPNKYAHRHPSSTRSIRWTFGRSDGSNFLQFFVNPSECQWKVATRTTIEKIAGGVIHHEWPQTGMYGSNLAYEKSRFDQPMLSISFQSGIITPSGYNDVLSNEEDSSAPAYGLGNFYDFLKLLDQSDMQANGEPNYIDIIYASPIFGGKGIWLQGFFTEEGVSWTDSANNPNMITGWGASFIVFSSQPNLSMLKQNFQLLGIPV